MTNTNFIIFFISSISLYNKTECNEIYKVKSGRENSINDGIRVSSAIADVIIDKILTRDVCHFDFIAIKNSSADIEIIDTIERNIQKKNSSWIKQLFVIEYETFPEWTLLDSTNEECFALCRSAFLIVNSFHDLMTLMKKNLENVFHSNLVFLIYCRNVNERELELLRYIDLISEDVESIESYQRGILIHYSYFILETQEKVKLFTFEWYTPDACNDMSLIEINVFDKMNMTWKRELKIDDKFRNFYQCRFVESEENFPGVKVLNEATSGLAKLGNATVIPFFKDYESKISKNPRDKRQKVTTDILKTHGYTFNSIDNVQSPYKTASFEDLHMTVVYKDDEYVLVVPPGAKYTIYEKIFLPFDETTWKFLIITLASVLGITICLNKMPQEIRELTYGKGVTIPIYNVLGTFFGISQFKLPENQFGRIILTTFIMFCLIIRTAYQGVMFEMMQQEMRKPIPKTIEELVNLNFSFYPRDVDSTYQLFQKLVKMDKNK
jgi:hypothetical protein